MNLTLKRFLTCLMSAGLTALTASAAAIVQDPFNDAGEGQSLTGDTGYRNGAWTASTNGADSSAIVKGEFEYNGDRPASGATGENKYLELNTQGATLSRTFNPQNLSNATDGIYVDTLVKFTKSDSEPETDSLGINPKLAIWMNNEGKIVVKCSDSGDPLIWTNSAATTDPEGWHRLTIKTEGNTDDGIYCTIWVDGGESLKGPEDDGTFAAISYDEGTFSSVSFQGTGGVDDLVVTTDNPLAAGPSAIILTLNWADTGIQSVVAGGETKTTGAEVASGTPLTITAQDWYRISSIEGATVEPAGPYTTKEVTVTPTAEANATVTITATQMDDPYAKWAISTGHTTEADKDGGTANYTSTFANYLLNVAPDVTNTTISIAQITMDADGAKVTVKANATAADITKINGQLVIEAVDDLNPTNTWNELQRESITNVLKTSTIKVAMPEASAGKDRQFYRAVVREKNAGE